MNYAIAALILSAISAFALENFGDHFQIGMHRIAIRESLAQKPMSGPIQGPATAGIPIFNPRYAQRELKKVLAKYEEAPQVLHYLGLSPQLDIPLVDNFPTFSDPNTVFTFPRNFTSNNGNSSAGAGPLVSPISVPFSKLPLTDFMSGGLDILYYGHVAIGTPPQTVTIDIDTGSADLWIASDCPDCFVDQFDPSKSSTFKNKHEEFSIAYGTGEVSGSLGEDIVSMAGLKYENQTFGLADSESHDFDGYPNSGILGLAFGAIATSGEPTVFENLMASGQVLAPFFSVHLTRGTKTGSEVCFGCFDVSKTKGSVTWVSVMSKTYWTVPMNGLRVNQTLLKTNIVAAIDTGTTLIYVPDEVAQELYKLIPGATSTDQFGSGFFTYPCDSKLDIAFDFGGSDFAIDKRDFNMGRVGANSADCVGGVISLGDGFPDDIAIIGDEFLKSWYTVYDYSNGARVGFAPSINNING